MARQAGIPMDKLGRQLGHTRTATTDIYMAEPREVSTEVSDGCRPHAGRGMTPLSIPHRKSKRAAPRHSTPGTALDPRPIKEDQES